MRVLCLLVTVFFWYSNNQRQLVVLIMSDSQNRTVFCFDLRSPIWAVAMHEGIKWIYTRLSLVKKFSSCKVMWSRTRHIWSILSLGHVGRWNISILKAKFHRFVSVLQASACGRCALQIRCPNFPMRSYTESWIGRRGRYKRQSGQRCTDIWWPMQSALSLLRFNSTSQSTSWSPGIGLRLLRRAACNLLWLQWHRISYPILPFAVTPTGRGSEGSDPVLGW